MNKTQIRKILLGDEKEWGNYIFVPGMFMKMGLSFEDSVKEGAITTVEMFQKGDISLAHLFQDGKIRCYNQEVGTVDDITFLEPIEITPNPDALINLEKNYEEVMGE